MIEDHPLYAEQLDLEADMVAAGMTSYFAAAEKRASAGRVSDTGSGAFVVSRSAAALAAAVEEFLSHSEAGKRGRKGRAYPGIKAVGSAVAAAVALKCTINTLGRPNRTKGVVLVKVADAIGRAIEGEAMVIGFEAEHPKLVKAVVDRLDRTTSHAAHRRRVIMAAMRSVSYKWKPWSVEDVVLVGLKLLDLLIDVTGLVQVEVIRSNKSTTRVISFTDAAIQAMKDKDSELSRSSPVTMPCIIPPRPWDANGVDGGYYSAVSLQPVRLVHKGYNEPYPAAVLAGVNALQDTPWRINRRLFDVFNEVVDRGMDHLGVLPPLSDLPIPPKPEDIATNDEARAQYRAEAAAAYSENTARRSKRVGVYRTLGVAQRFVDRERIYFPHTLDFRGRAYPMPLWLNPQGPDYVKAMLEFADGKPIGDGQGPGWLAIHGANCFGVDKVSLEDRIEWTELHTEAIVRTASDPLQHLWWTEADSPFQFLAFCMEWSAYLDAVRGGRAEHFVSHLPVMVDGSCNGIQHFSAMLRDPVGGRATNLVPSARPSDIYASVADAVIARLRSDLARPERSDVAAKWITFGIDRKITKRSVMVLPYGGKFTSCRAYVEDAVRERGPTPWAGDVEAEREALSYLSRVVWESIGDVVVGARTAMAWLQSAASLVFKHKASGSVWWRTPTGFKATQRYWKKDVSRIDTVFHGSSRVMVNIAKDSRDPDRNRHVSGFSPNFVHSLDASALMETVNLSVDNGVTHFAAVHDSYGTHASDMQVLAACIRHAFVTMYEEHDVLDALHSTLQSQLPDGVILPPPPPKGTLDIRSVLDSDFFFA